jgi:hypothetical protein
MASAATFGDDSGYLLLDLGANTRLPTERRLVTFCNARSHDHDALAGYQVLLVLRNDRHIDKRCRPLPGVNPGSHQETRAHQLRCLRAQNWGFIDGSGSRAVNIRDPAGYQLLIYLDHNRLVDVLEPDH